MFRPFLFLLRSRTGLRKHLTGVCEMNELSFVTSIDVLLAFPAICELISVAVLVAWYRTLFFHDSLEELFPCQKDLTGATFSSFTKQFI